MTFRYRLTEEEYFRFNYYTAWADPRKKRYRINYFVRVIVLYAAVALVYILATSPRLIWIDISVFLVTGVTYLLLIPYLVRRSVYRRVNDILSKKENAHILEESEIILAAEGITDRDTVSESRYNWEAIVHFADTEDAFYLYTNSHHAIVIPRRVIVGADKLEETLRLIKSHLPLHA